jgi:hypothetical protein
MTIAKWAYLAGVALFFACLPSASQAVDYVLVPNMSTLKWQEASNRVYLRNLNDYAATFLGCCYSFYVDIKTDEGKAQWSAMLARMAIGGRLYIGVTSKTTSGVVIHVGDW